MTAERAGDGTDFTLPQVARLLRDADDAVILTHRNPDGDAVGSAAALAAGLRHLGKRATIVCPDAVPDYLLTVPGAREIIPALDRNDWGIVITVDVSDPTLLRPLAAAELEFYDGRLSLNIDHHYSNLRYARHNHVDIAAASASEIVGDLLKNHLGLPYSKDVATDLLYGIVNDTHSFQNTNTTPATLRMSADLVEAGADLAAIVFTLLLEKRPAAARLWAETLPSLSFAEEGHVAFLTVSLEALVKAGATLTDADGLVEFLRNVQGVELGVLFKQTAVDEYRLSMRTSASIDATIVAGLFGGGGHQRASGGDAKGDLHTIKQRIVESFRASRVDIPE